MRRKIIAGNWKMNCDWEEGLKLSSEVVNMADNEIDHSVDIILIPPFIHLKSIDHFLKSRNNFFLGAQNCCIFSAGAYTGEVSAQMLKSVGVEYVLVGHSERRNLFFESDEVISRKVIQIIENGLIPIFCCGESLETRQKKQEKSWVINQITSGLFHFEEEDFKKVIIAYEPIWAIGTGQNASWEQAQEMHNTIRNVISEQYSADVGLNTSILYGGSVKQDNAAILFDCPDIDGALIGGASLNSREFINIAKSLSQIKKSNEIH